MTENIDIAVKRQTNGFFDIDINESTGDFVLTPGFNTNLKMALFEDRRADRSEMVPPERRRGWWGNELFDEIAFEIGSKLWLLDQARLNQETLNRAVDYVRQSLQWLIDDGHLTEVSVSGELRPDTIVLTIDLIRDGSLVESRSFDIWNSTELEVN